uniref:Methylmalonyl Co-A mutase-associated GTPase MeaB n=1 Tax=Bellilinea caldifistulae TaxID=360411 RepID=A0A7C4Q3W2_9CHLR
MTTLAEEVLAGSRLALARLLTLIENEDPQGEAALDRLFPHSGRAHWIGVTGSPGAGKSSLVNRLARAFRSPADGSPPRTVAIVAVDPSSPFTGGALLGDRVRMRDLSGDPGVFIRSMASRGALGGLARTTPAVVQALDGAGFDIILIETVGAGQSEVEIARLAHTVIVVEAPGMGDDIQAIKAGILEIADILVLNKADLPGAENALRTLRSMLELGHPGRESAPPSAPSSEWRPPLIATVAIQNEGIPELMQHLQAHAEYLRRSGGWQVRDRSRLQTQLEELLQATLLKRWRSSLPDGEYQQILTDLQARRISPYQALHSLLGEAPFPQSFQRGSSALLT